MRQRPVKESFRSPTAKAFSQRAGVEEIFRGIGLTTWSKRPPYQAESKSLDQQIVLIDVNAQTEEIAGVIVDFNTRQELNRFAVVGEVRLHDLLCVRDFLPCIKVSGSK